MKLFLAFILLVGVNAQCNNDVHGKSNSDDFLVSANPDVRVCARFCGANGGNKCTCWAPKKGGRGSCVTQDNFDAKAEKLEKKQAKHAPKTPEQTAAENKHYQDMKTEEKKVKNDLKLYSFKSLAQVGHVNSKGKCDKRSEEMCGKCKAWVKVCDKKSEDDCNTACDKLEKITQRSQCKALVNGKALGSNDAQLWQQGKVDCGGTSNFEAIATNACRVAGCCKKEAAAGPTTEQIAAENLRRQAMKAEDKKVKKQLDANSFKSLRGQ